MKYELWSSAHGAWHKGVFAGTHGITPWALAPWTLLHINNQMFDHMFLFTPYIRLLKVVLVILSSVHTPDPKITNLDRFL